MGKLTISTGPLLPVRFLYVKTRPGIYLMEKDGKKQHRCMLDASKSGKKHKKSQFCS
jgi:hypothetical protein